MPIKKVKISPIFFFLLPSIALLSIMVVYPTLYLLYLSFTDFNLMYALRDLKFVGFYNYLQFLLDGLIWTVVIPKTFMFVFGSLFFELLLGLALSQLFFTKLKLNRIMRTLIVVPLFIPPAIVGLIWSFMYIHNGLFNFLLSSSGLPVQPWLSDPLVALPGVIAANVWQWTPFAFLVLLASTLSLPPAPQEAAIIDGASSWQKFRHVILPSLVPAMLIVILIRLIYLFQTFDIIFILTGGGPGTATYVFVINLYLQAFRNYDIAYASAISIILIVFMTGITLLFIKVYRKTIH